MHADPPRHWSQHITRAALLVLGCALLARLIYDLLTPLIPAAVALLVLGLVALWATRRGRP